VPTSKIFSKSPIFLLLTFVASVAISEALHYGTAFMALLAGLKKNLRRCGDVSDLRAFAAILGSQAKFVIVAQASGARGVAHSGQ